MGHVAHNSPRTHILVLKLYKAWSLANNCKQIQPQLLTSVLKHSLTTESRHWGHADESPNSVLHCKLGGNAGVPDSLAMQPAFSRRSELRNHFGRKLIIQRAIRLTLWTAALGAL